MRYWGVGETAKDKQPGKKRQRERNRGRLSPLLIHALCGVSALYAFPCLQKGWCLCAHADDFDSRAVSAKTRPINCNGFICLEQVSTANILAGPPWNSTRTDQTHTEMSLMSQSCNFPGELQ